jgi:cytochrome b
MATPTDAAGGSSVMAPASAAERDDPALASVRVWDVFVRVFHWSLVTLFVAAFATGDEVEGLHIALGYAIAVLVGLRIVWGFVGSRHARFGDFVRSRAESLDYLRKAVRGRAPRYLGHNPAGGLMTLALLGMTIAIAATGYLMTTDAFWGSEPMEELHEGLVYATLALIALHVAGVLLASIEHRENLVWSMFTGRKRVR